MALWAIAGVLLLTVAFLLDDSLMTWVDTHQFKPAKNAAGWISRFGDLPPLCVLGVFLFLRGWLKRNRRWMRIAAFMLAAALLAGLLANGMRAVCGRTRPNMRDVPAGWYGPYHAGHWVVNRNKYHSFPSGHSAVIFAFFAPLIAYETRGRNLAITAIVSVAASRIYLADHHLSDVIAGFIVAAVSFWVVEAYFSKRMRLNDLPNRAG